MGNGPFSGAVGSLFPDARVSSREQTGWVTKDITPPTPNPTPASAVPLGYDFSDDLSQMVVKIPMQPLTAGMPTGTENIYNLFLQRKDGTYSLIDAAAPTSFPPSECEICIQFIDNLAFAGASSDFTHILFEANDSLEGTGAASGSVGNLYENVGGVVRNVGILPDGVVAAEGAAPGAGGTVLNGILYSSIAANAWQRVGHAISQDGSRVIFQATADEGPPDPAQNGMKEVYERIEGSTTVEVSAPTPGATPENPAAAPAQFWDASQDGSLVFFTSNAELTTASYTGPANNTPDLYRYNAETGQTVDLTVDTNPADAATGAGVDGVVGVSSDGATVYFVATGELVNGEGVDGQPNLYVSHEDPETHVSELFFIATLAEADAGDWTATQQELQSYVTADGEHVAFMSVDSLTGYDNADRYTGLRDSQVFEFSADTGELVCASCDPNGARPVGSAFVGATLSHFAGTSFHQPRVLSQDGSRLFFSSPDRLVPGAASPHVKIYEYERSGMGSCQEEEGCVSLISGGANTTDDIFLDASSDGSDVFFSTLSQLAATDRDNLVDVYDARVDGGFPEAASPTVCFSHCQQPSGGGDALEPLASGFGGASGNLAPPKVRPKTTTVKSKLARALQACPKKPKKKRIRCEARVRKRFHIKSKAIRASRPPISATNRRR